MTLLSFLFRRQTDDRPQSVLTDAAEERDVEAGGNNTAAPEPANDMLFAPTASGPHGHARKIGRPTSIRRPNPKPDRVRSRLMNTGQLDAAIDEFEGHDDQKGRAVTRPVGWLVIIEGPGTGAWFTLQSGLAQIGQGADQTISLNYGDTAISRVAHASLAYEPADHRFRLGLGKCENKVLVNATPVHATTDLHHGDLITVGETTLRLAAFCDDQFAWAPIIDKGGQNALSA